MTAVTMQSQGVTVASREVALIELLDRLLQGGIVIRAQIELCAANVPLVGLDVSVIIAAIGKLAGRT